MTELIVIGVVAAVCVIATAAQSQMVRRDDRKTIDKLLENNVVLVDELVAFRQPDIEISRLQAQRDAAVAAKTPLPDDRPRRRSTRPINIETADDILSAQEREMVFNGMSPE